MTKIKINQPVEVELATVRLQAKIRDEGVYAFEDTNGNVVIDMEGEYVPNDIIPGTYGDYIDLVIDLKTGQITNWNSPSPQVLQRLYDQHHEANS